ncbi:kinase-like domain-containing protein, partial [Tanacetum coccineum]
EKGWFLSRLACHHYENGTLTEIIDPILRQEMDQDSVNVFSAIAYGCLNMDPSTRPTAPMVLEELRKAQTLRGNHDFPDEPPVSNRIGVLAIFSYNS